VPTRVIPASNAHLLASRIPNARLVVFEGAGHLLFWERAEELNTEVIRFLREVDHNQADHLDTKEGGGVS
jgi:pimeloyl-ACP methyl ester carboxylesterase